MYLHDQEVDDHGQAKEDGARRLPTALVLGIMTGSLIMILEASARHDHTQLLIATGMFNIGAGILFERKPWR